MTYQFRAEILVPLLQLRKETEMLARRLLALAAALLLCATPLARAADLPVPTGQVLLTVDGAITVHNHDKEAIFDREMLEAMPQTTFTTKTIWTDGEQEFTGVTLHNLLTRLGVTSGSLSAIAINDYAVKIPVSDAVADGPIIAYAQNGKPMSVRDKGPLWILYPYDSKSEYRTEVIYSRSIWQLARITVSP